MKEIYCPTKVFIGENAIKKLPELSKNCGKKPFIITGKNFLKKTGLLRIIEDSLGKKRIKYIIYDGIEPNTDIKEIEQAYSSLKENECDHIIAIGGGSVIDSGKIVGLLATNSGNCMDFLDNSNIINQSIPLIAVQTIAGTGSEVTKYAVFSNRITRGKYTVKSEKVFPTYAIVDPEFTLSSTVEATQNGIIDCLVHSIEGLTNVYSDDYVKALAIYNIDSILKIVDDLLQNLNDIKLRSKMSYCSMIGGIIINNARTGLIHTMAAALDPYCDLHHGEIVGRLLPNILEFYVQKGGCDIQFREIGLNCLHMHSYNGGSDVVNSFQKIIMSQYGSYQFRDQQICFDLVDSFVERVYMDLGLFEVSPVSLNKQELKDLFIKIIGK